MTTAGKVSLRRQKQKLIKHKEQKDLPCQSTLHSMEGGARVTFGRSTSITESKRSLSSIKGCSVRSVGIILIL